MTRGVVAVVMVGVAVVAADTENSVLQREPVVAPVTAPRRADGKPDLRGVWMPPFVPDMTRNGANQRGYAEPPFSAVDVPAAREALFAKGVRAELPFTSAGLQQWTSYDVANGDYTGSCFPGGLTRSMNAPYPFQIMQDEQTVALLFEVNTWHHTIPLNAPMPTDLNPTWFGTSVGRWSGDTLVVETRGFNGYTKLDTIGHPHSDQLHVTQTFTRTDLTHLVYTLTIDDPKIYTKPWSNERVLTLIKGPLLEYSCEENNKSLWEGRIKVWTPPWAKSSSSR